MLENRLHIQNGKQLKVSHLKLQHHDECKSQSYGKYLKFNVRTVLSYKRLKCAGMDTAQELKIKLPRVLVIPLLGIYLKETKTLT